ncbi:MAG: hypothetical protein MZV49_25165 [Rhodopseudomonas palustris]|nr:hypothetical protein [Rhodopseudomonas palustris]
MPVGFKNGTDGNVQIAVDAVAAAGAPHRFVGVTKQGVGGDPADRRQRGLLRHPARRHAHGRTTTPRAVEAACDELGRGRPARRVMVDCSHGNSGKDHQPAGRRGRRRRRPDRPPAIAASIGVMVESHLVEGRQDVRNPGAALGPRPEHHRRLPLAATRPCRCSSAWRRSRVARSPRSPPAQPVARAGR